MEVRKRIKKLIKGGAGGGLLLIIVVASIVVVVVLRRRRKSSENLELQLSSTSWNESRDTEVTTAPPIQQHKFDSGSNEKNYGIFLSSSHEYGSSRNNDYEVGTQQRTSSNQSLRIENVKHASKPPSATAIPLLQLSTESDQRSNRALLSNQQQTPVSSIRDTTVDRNTHDEFDDYVISYSGLILKKKIGEGRVTYFYIFKFLKEHLEKFTKENSRKQKLQLN